MNQPRAFQQILWLQLRLLWRGYLYDRSALFLLFLALAGGIPGSLRLAGIVGSSLERGGALDLPLLGLFAFWALAPLSVSALVPASAEPGQLLLYPVRARTIAAALALASLADPATLLALPVAAAALRSAGPRLALPLLLLLAIAALLGQAAQFLGSALTRSRRFRDASALALPALAAAGTLLALNRPAHAVAPTLPVLASAPTPLPHTLARAAADGDGGAYVGLLAWAAGAAALAGAAATARAAAREISGGSVRARPFRLPGSHGAMREKEIRYFAREPYYRGALSRSGIALFFVGAITLQPPNGPLELAPTLGTSATLYLGLWLLQHLGNPWGTESAAGFWLWTLPGARGRWLLGKNLALLPVTLGVLGFVLAEYALLARAPLALILRLTGVFTLWAVAALALGNVAGTVLPFPVLGRAARHGGGQTFGMALLYVGIGILAGIFCTLWLAPLWILLLYAGSLPLCSFLAARFEFRLIERLQ